MIIHTSERLSAMMQDIGIKTSAVGLGAGIFAGIAYTTGMNVATFYLTLGLAVGCLAYGCTVLLIRWYADRRRS